MNPLRNWIAAREERAWHNDRDSACKYWWGDRSGSGVGVSNERCNVCRPKALSASAPAEQLVERVRELVDGEPTPLSLDTPEYDYQPVRDPENNTPPLLRRYDGGAYGQHVQVGDDRSLEERAQIAGTQIQAGILCVPPEVDAGALADEFRTWSGAPVIVPQTDRVSVPVEAIEKIREAVAPWADFEGKPPYWVRVLTELLEGIDNA